MDDGFGDRLQALRVERGLSASELARRVDVTPTAVWNWEKNGVLPRRGMLAGIAETLSTTPDYLLSGLVAASSKRDEQARSAPSGRTVAQIIEAARREIAAATGFEVERVKLQLQIGE